MFIVNIKDVRIGEITDPKHPQQKLLILEYLDRQYILVQTFPLSGSNTAQNLWRHLTDDRSIDRYLCPFWATTSSIIPRYSKIKR